jgi:glycosyltransferase involved in cell wall biosynthesis
MRVAIARSSNIVIGGIERYLQRFIPELLARNVEVAFVCEKNSRDPDNRIVILDDCEVWSVDETGAEATCAALRVWRPDVIFAHGFNDPTFEAEVMSIAPCVFYAHEYYGTCVSGRKAFSAANYQTCNRSFGPTCLACFYPRRCGGLNPITMLRDYRRQEARLVNLRRSVVILTASAHMRTEYLRNGFAPGSVHVVHLPVESPGFGSRRRIEVTSRRSSLEQQMNAVNLLFLGRMVREKGGQILIDALPLIAESLGRIVRLEMTGDGPARPAWEKQALALCSQNSKVQIDFSGWCVSDNLEAAFRKAHLLVVPSLWPEPFGLVGIEAGVRGLPVAAFQVGGIPEWLRDGINGHLAHTDPMNADSLAKAVAQCLRDPQHYAQLCEGALEVGGGFTMSKHLERLLGIFADQSSGDDVDAYSQVEYHI